VRAPQSSWSRRAIPAGRFRLAKVELDASLALSDSPSGATVKRTLQPPAITSGGKLCHPAVPLTKGWSAVALNSHPIGLSQESGDGRWKSNSGVVNTK
jgi:hypothetical protein